jgi:predicted AlkP superfamily pyrophosphatase or phosphodiesterase
MIKRISLLLFCTLIFTFVLKVSGQNSQLRPKLVVGIVIDQMRYDYLYRYYDLYSENGFKRLMSLGMNFTYAHYNYIPTYTGPGHASIYTGTTPYYHGIISNDWYDKYLKKTVYCTSDSTCQTVGADNASGQMSPQRLLASTIGDELRMSNNGLSRVFAVSIKDRAAILPGGHMANAAYWYDGKSGRFVTSTYYTKSLPPWISNFNSNQLPSRLMASGWNLSLPESSYLRSMPDNGAGETDVFKEGETNFPHSFEKVPLSSRLDLLRTTPFGNDLLAEFVMDLIKNEKPGQGPYTDLLAVSFSSTDYVGHAYGPNSVEIMDTYLRLDKQIARILDALDNTVGKGNYLLFLTSDHAVKPNGAYLQENHLPNGSLDDKVVTDSLRSYCLRHYGYDNLIETVNDNQVYFNHQLIESKKTDLHELNTSLISYLRTTFPQMNTISSKEDFNSKMPTRTMTTFALNGFNPSRSGDLLFDMAIGYLTGSYHEGTSHGAAFDYDTHVPLIFYGWKVKPGESNAEVYVEDIAPTITNLIHVQEPNGTLGVPVIPAIR